MVLCNLLGENIQHLFFECVSVRRQWAEADVIAHQSTFQSIGQGDLFGSLEKALLRQSRCPAQLILLVETLHTIWIERNQVAWKGNYFRFPWDFVIRSAILQVQVDETTSSKKRSILLCSFESL